MNIIKLNTSLIESPVLPLDDAQLRQFYKKVAGKLDKLPDTKQYKRLNGLYGPGEATNLGFLDFMADAYSAHRKIEIAPHDVWYVVLTELATFIKKNADQCRPLFTRSPEKVQVTVPSSDPASIDMQAVIDQLRDLVPVDINLFVPHLSTHDNDSKFAHYAAFADGVKVYYDYCTFMCGIPEIRITGTEEDWSRLWESAVKIRSEFIHIGAYEVADYMRDVADILLTFIDTFDGDALHPDKEVSREIVTNMFKDIFSKKNIGSGREFEIRGWITYLFMQKCDLPKLENFSTNISVVPYKNLDTGREFVGVHGAFRRVRSADGFVKLGYNGIAHEIV